MAKRRKTRGEPVDGDLVCRVCLQPIRGIDKVRRTAATLIHEACDYARARRRVKGGRASRKLRPR